MTNPYTAENEIYSVLPGGIRVKGLVFTHKIYLIVLFYFIFHADKRVLFLVQATARNGTVTLRFKHFYLISETWPLEDHARFPFPHTLFGVLCWPAPLLTSICIYSWLTSVY